MESGFAALSACVVSNGFCAGCGACVSMCNHGAIDVGFNDIGQYEPFCAEQGACVDCGRCLSVCPFYNENPDEGAIGEALFGDKARVRHTEETGYYLDSYVGHADEGTRMNGASGGSVSQLLKHLLGAGLVDGVITVEPTRDHEKRFQYTIVDSPEEVDRCAGSAYYPVELSRVLRRARKESRRYAIVGLPCALKAVALAKSRSPRLRNNILFSIGLVCGQMKSKKYTEHLIRDAALRPDDIERVSYRKKVEGELSSNYAFELTTASDSRYTRMFSDGVSTLWCDDFYKQKCCFHCDDVFAECADAAFMDAWLPDYTGDHRGTSLLVIRNETIDEYIKGCADYTPITIRRVVESQQAVIASKRAYRAIYDGYCSEGEYLPKKRAFAVAPTESEQFVRMKYENARISRLGRYEDSKKRIRQVERTYRGGLIKRVARRLLRPLLSPPAPVSSRRPLGPAEK